MAINRTTVSKKQTVDILGKPAKNAYNYKFTALEKSFNSWLEGVRVGRTEKHHRIVLKFLEPYLAKMSKKQALEVMKIVAQKTGFAYGDAKGNLINLARELHTKDINAVHNLLQRFTSLQGVKQSSEFLAESIQDIKWRGENVKVGNLVTHDGAGNYGIDPRRRIVGGQSDASLEFVDYFSKQKDVNKQADLLIGLLEQARPSFDGATAAAVYLSDNPKLTLEHKKRVLRQLGPEAQVWMEDFIGVVERDSANTLLEASKRLDAHQLDKNFYKGKEVTRADDLATLKQQEKLADLVQGFKESKIAQGLPYKEATAASAVSRIDNVNPLIKNALGATAPNVHAYGGGAAALTQTADPLAGLGRAVSGIDSWGSEKIAKFNQARQIESIQNAAKWNAAWGGDALKLGAKFSSLLPVAGLAADVWDMNERNKIAAKADASALDKFQAWTATFAVGAAAVPVVGQGANFVAGVGNLAIDAGRTVFEEDKREDFLSNSRAIGQVTRRTLQGVLGI
tara:strand:- start:216 stop:1745 length:1530 start_codon:yes stop_codon:yes gene_type:complete